MNTILVTGGAGFIGSTLVEKLLIDNMVIVIDNFCDYYDVKLKEENIKEFCCNSNFKLYRVDIRDVAGIKKVFDENKIDVVIHLAAMAGVGPSIENPVIYQEVNGIGTQNILEEARKHGIKKIILASSSSVYGNCKEKEFTEDLIVDFPISPYAATKKANEIMSHVYHKLYDMDIILLRFFTVYGPRQRPDLAISKFTKLMMEGKEIKMYGDGSSFRDYTYIDDIVDGIIKSYNYITNNKSIYEIINLGTNNPISLKNMISIIGEILNIKPIIKIMPMQSGDVNSTYANIEKAQKLLGYKPNTDFKEGVAKFIEWYKKTSIL